jgi:hypothetical protein
MDIEQEFQNQMGRIEGPVLNSSSKVFMFGLLCREKEKWGMQIHATDPVSEADIRRHLPFTEVMEASNRRSLRAALQMDGVAYVFFDSQKRLRKAFGTASSQTGENPFSITTIHKKGVVLNDST